MQDEAQPPERGGVDLVLGSVWVWWRDAGLRAPEMCLLLVLRALPVMYAVALDLRVFANNVSSGPAPVALS